MNFLTKQEKIVLIVLGFIFLAGMALHCSFKSFPGLHNIVNLMDSECIYPKVDINRATTQELVKIPHIGPTTAARIIDYRKRNKAFRKLEELKLIAGIGEEKAEKISLFLKIRKNKR